MSEHIDSTLGCMLELLCGISQIIFLISNVFQIGLLADYPFLSWQVWAPTLFYFGVVFAVAIICLVAVIVAALITKFLD